MPFTAPDTLATSLYDELKRQVQSGALQPGARLNEMKLASSLAVSRTPLREALNKLAANRIILSTPRIGFQVPPLTVAEFRDLYAMRAILDCAALELAGLPDAETIDRLDELTARMSRERSAARRIELDDSFHLLLVAGCGNRLLLDTITDLMGRTRRYELAYLAEQAAVDLAVDEHHAILDALRRGDLGAAILALRANLSSGMEPLIRWLERKHPQQD